MNQRQSHDTNTFLFYYRRRETSQQKSMCDLSVPRYNFLENFHDSECVDCAEKFSASTANKIFLPTSVSNAICMKYQRRWYKICVRGLCVKLLKLMINVRLSAEICLPQRLSARNEHALHFVQNLEIPKSVARNFNRYGICMKYQRHWYKICVRGLCVKLLKLRINVRLSAEICLPQSCLRVISMLHILCKISRSRKVLLEILTDMESVWNIKEGDVKYVFVGCAENCLKLGWNGWFSLFWTMLMMFVSCFGGVFCISM